MEYDERKVEDVLFGAADIRREFDWELSEGDLRARPCRYE